MQCSCIHQKLKFSVMVYTKHVAKIQNEFVKVFVMCKYDLAIFHSLVNKLKKVFHSMLNVVLY